MKSLWKLTLSEIKFPRRYIRKITMQKYLSIYELINYVIFKLGFNLKIY